jgi:LmbE family N-acetylglucosaminyl deacetylase
MTMERLAKMREEEQRRAADALGVRDVTFLGHNDGEVEVTMALRSELVYAIRRAQPDVLFTFDPWRPYEIHPDHRNVGTCALDALAAARMPMYYPEQLTGDLTQHRLKQVYLFSTGQPNHWVDVSDYLEKKLEALHCHVSQVSDSVDEIVRQRAGIIGVEHGYKYGESFHHMALR